MNSEQICQNIVACCDKLGKAKLLGIPLENADPRFLEIEEVSDISEHVRLQPAAITFFGMLKRNVSRRLSRRKMEYDYWKKAKYSEAKNSLGAKKPTIADVEAKMFADNEKSLKEWEDEIYALQEQVDALDAYYEGWRQKGFSLQQHAGIVADELFTKDFMRLDDAQKNLLFSKKKERMRGIMKQSEKQ